MLLDLFKLSASYEGTQGLSGTCFRELLGVIVMETLNRMCESWEVWGRPQQGLGIDRHCSGLNPGPRINI